MISACQSAQSEGAAGQSASAAQFRPVGVVQTFVPPATEETVPDLCRAAELQWLVGRPRMEIPVPVDLSNRRVACTTCPITEDHIPTRLNIFFDQQTDRVQSVRCG